MDVKKLLDQAVSKASDIPAPAIPPDPVPVPAEPESPLFVKGGHLAIRLNTAARISMDRVSVGLLEKIKQAFTYPNPAYHKAMRLKSLYPPEKNLYAWYVDDAGRMCIPAASLRWAIDFFQSHRVTVRIEDLTRSRPFPSTVAMRPPTPETRVDRSGFLALNEKRFGIMVGDTGDVRRLYATYLMTARKEKTLIVVKRKHQLYQWRDALVRLTFLTPDQIGLVGDKNMNLAAKVVVGIDRTLHKKLPELTDRFGFLVVDRCDLANMKIFYKLVGNVGARYVLGLAATQTREDGLTRIMTAYCGPVRFVAPATLSVPGRVPSVVVARTKTVYTVDGEYDQVLDDLCNSPVRTEQIVMDILALLAQDKSAKVIGISVRNAHLTEVAAGLEANFSEAGIIHGNTRPALKKEIEDRFNAGDLRVLLTTTKTIGAIKVTPVSAGVVMAPFKYRDTATNLVHRLTGPDATVIEYKDDCGFFLAALSRRLKIYRELRMPVTEG